VIAATLSLVLLLFQGENFVSSAVIGHVNTVDGVSAVATRVVIIAAPRETPTKA
jgi:hypothetical protein